MQYTVAITVRDFDSGLCFLPLCAHRAGYTLTESHIHMDTHMDIYDPKTWIERPWVLRAIMEAQEKRRILEHLTKARQAQRERIRRKIGEEREIRGGGEIGWLPDSPLRPNPPTPKPLPPSQGE